MEKLLFLLGSHSNMKKNPEYWNSSPDLLENDQKLKKKGWKDETKQTSYGFDFLKIQNRKRDI